MRGLNIKNDAPAFTIHIVGPIVVGDDDLAILGPASSGDESATVAGAFEIWSVGGFLALIEPGHIVVRQFFKSVEGNNVVNVQHRAGARV